jgi:hypothetical protein
MNVLMIIEDGGGHIITPLHVLQRTPGIERWLLGGEVAH